MDKFQNSTEDTDLNDVCVSKVKSYFFYVLAGVLDLMEHLFQGQLVLRTRCLECECFTERREVFQDISVPVLDEQPSSPEDLSESERF